MSTPKHLFRQTVTLYTSDNKSTDEYGRQTWTGGSDYKARVELNTKVMKDEQGEEQQVDGTVWFEPNVDNLAVGDRLDFNSKTYRIFRIHDTPDDLGNNRFTEVVIQRWNF